MLKGRQPEFNCHDSGASLFKSRLWACLKTGRTYLSRAQREQTADIDSRNRDINTPSFDSLRSFADQLPKGFLGKVNVHLLSLDLRHRLDSFHQNSKQHVHHCQGS